MSIQPFKLERFFAKYEFKVEHLLSPSDCESLPMAELVSMASPESLALWQSLKLGYTESQGHPHLRAEIAALYDQVAPEGVLTAVPEEAIYIVMQTLLQPEDHVITVSPAYQSLYEIARSKGCRVTHWMAINDAHGWSFDLDWLENSITEQTQMLVINFPHNPTGHNLTHSEFDALIGIAHKHDLILFSDEMYRLLEFDEAMRLPAVCDVYEKGISLSGVSKSLALPGLRVGWLATQQNTWIDRWQAYKDYTTICGSAPGEILALIALQNREHILQRNLEIIRENTAIAATFFNRHNDLFSWIPPRAGSIAFPAWLGAGTVEQFCQAVLDRLGVMIVPGSMFEHPGNHFRLGLGRRNFGEGLMKVEHYLKA